MPTATREAEPLALDIQPLTPDRWSDLEALFGKQGAYSGCWCMWKHGAAAGVIVRGAAARVRVTIGRRCSTGSSCRVGTSRCD